MEFQDPVGGADRGASASRDGTFDFERSPLGVVLAQRAESAVGWFVHFGKAVRRGSPGAVLGFVLALFFVLFAGQVLVRDETVDVHTALHLIPPGALCANQEDMLDDESRLCQLRNTFAYAYLLGHSWAACAPHTVGARLLRMGQDDFGNFWYGPEKREDVRQFYATCAPTCADAADVYDAAKGACMVSNQLALVFLSSGQARGKGGGLCAKSTPGGNGILSESKQISDGNLWYRPELASRVAAFYASCVPACARGDAKAVLQDSQTGEMMAGHVRCRVENVDALAYLQAQHMLEAAGIAPGETIGSGGATCDDESPGRRAIVAEQSGDGRDAALSFWYHASKGAAVQSWYSSCTEGPVVVAQGVMGQDGGHPRVGGSGRGGARKE